MYNKFAEYKAKFYCCKPKDYFESCKAIFRIPAKNETNNDNIRKMRILKLLKDDLKD